MVMSWFYVNILLLNTYILNIQQYKMGNRQNEERLPLWFVCAFICKPCENTLVGYTNYIDYTWLWCITIQCGVEWVNVVYNYKLVWSQKIGRKIVLSDLTIWQNIFYICSSVQEARSAWLFSSNLVFEYSNDVIWNVFMWKKSTHMYLVP